MITISHCEQNSEEWFRLRMGIPTASCFGTIYAGANGKGRGGDEKYMNRLVAETILGKPLPSYTSPDTERGKVEEAELRADYCMLYATDVERVGFIRNGSKGGSPDALIGANGLLEIKSQRPDLLVQTHCDGEFPQEHVAQTQGLLWIAEREWVDLFVGSPGMRPFIKRAYRDDGYIAKLAKAVDIFNEKLAQRLEFMRKQAA